MGFAVGACDDLIDCDNFSLDAIQEASTKLVPPVGCCIGAIGSIVIPWVGPGSQVEDVHLLHNQRTFCTVCLTRCICTTITIAVHAE